MSRFSARLAQDKVSPRSAFIRARKVEVRYAAQLRKVARHVGDIVRGMYHPNDPASVAATQRALEDYSRAIAPWAEAVGGRMVAEVAARDARAWADVSREMSRSLRREIETAPVGQFLRDALAEQVTLIKSIPLDAAQRVHHLATEAALESTRASDIADEIMRTNDVSQSKATLIARTESARVSSLLTQVRSQHVGITQFVWQTARDSSVRKSHRAMQGKVCSYVDPPIVDGEPLVPGQIYNCRCFAVPVIPDDL